MDAIDCCCKFEDHRMNGGSHAEQVNARKQRCLSAVTLDEQLNALLNESEFQELKDLGCDSFAVLSSVNFALSLAGKQRLISASRRCFAELRLAVDVSAEVVRDSLPTMPLVAPIFMGNPKGLPLVLRQRQTELLIEAVVHVYAVVCVMATLVVRRYENRASPTAL